MTHEELYDILNNTIPLESDENIKLNECKLQFDNQLSVLDAKENDEAINVKTIKQIFDNLNQLNKLVIWGVQNYNVK